MTLTLEAPRIVRTRPLLQVTGLSKSYGPVTALRDVSAQAHPGEVLGIVGESGSGKSTLLRMMNLEEQPDRGSYALDLDDAPGNLFDLDRFARRMLCATRIGIVYQNPHLGLLMRHSSSGNVAERLLVAGERSFATLRAKATTALEASEFPLDRLDAPPITLSGGMQQRVQLAKAIALEPALLLLDEPTTGLEQERKITMVIVSHDLGVIRTLADRVMVMRRGEVVETGLADQVFQDPQHAYTQQLVHAKL